MELLKEVEKIANLGSYQTDLTKGTWTGSENFIQIFGLTPQDEYTIEDFQKIVHPEDFQDVMTYFGACLTQQKDFNYEYRCLKTNGTIIHVSSRSHVYYDDDGTPLRIIGIKQDITKQKLREEKLTALNTALKLLNAKKNKTLANVAHDLRNPISAIQGLTNLLKSELEAEQLELLQLQEEALDYTKTIISELLDVANLEKHNQPFKKVKTDLNLLIFKSIQQFQSQAFKKNIEIKTQLASNAIVPLNPNKFSRVIDNLISNAIKFTPQRKSIKIQTTVYQETVILSIKDEGIGIPEQRIPFMFESLPQDLKRAGTAGEKSTGLGLSIVKEIVDLHDASIKIKSKENKGTTFEIKLKRA
ncbi:MAG: PAS domain-containing sensor histidine kinase [Saprospiraceae bacterium]